MSEPSVSAPIERLVGELQHAMRRDAARQRRRGQRLNKALIAALSVVGVTTGVAGATGALGIFQSTPSYEIGEHQGAPDGRLCLDLRHPGRRPVYGCGQAPTDSQPFGLLVVAVQPDHVRVVFGVVAEHIRAVRIGGRDVPTETRSGLTGRFFSLEVPDRGPVYAEGFDGSGDLVAHVGSKVRSGTTPSSLAQARAQGDVAGFAPAVSGDGTFVYRGQEISPDRAATLGLNCTEDDTTTVRCSDPK